jgi:hypothetical protein
MVDTPIFENEIAVFSTAFELRGADLPFFSCRGKKCFLNKKIKFLRKKLFL